jgi:hypothetical protein
MMKLKTARFMPFQFLCIDCCYKKKLKMTPQAKITVLNNIFSFRDYTVAQPMATP